MSCWFRAAKNLSRLSLYWVVTSAVRLVMVVVSVLPFFVTLTSSHLSVYVPIASYGNRGKHPAPEYTSTPSVFVDTNAKLCPFRKTSWSIVIDLMSLTNVSLF